MPKRSRKKVEDVNQTAHRVVAEATGQIMVPVIVMPTSEGKQKDPAAVSLGRRGGLKGGRRRAESLTPERRSEIARLGAEKRWRPKKAED